MDGRRWRDDDSSPAPVGIMDALHKRDPVQLAMLTFQERETLRPVEIPLLPRRSQALEKLMNADRPSTVPEELRDERDAYCAARDARIHAKAENARRLRSSLWAEQCLRKAGKSEHHLLRAFNKQTWGVIDAASEDFAVRELQVKVHA